VPKSRICSIEGCDNLAHSRGWCSNHYGKWHAYGDPEFPTPYRSKKGDPLKFLLNVALPFSGEECLIWPHGRDKYGAAKVYYDKRWISASRVLCKLTKGDPPSPKHDTCHSCGNGWKGCVNPGHLRWGTRLENQADRIKHGTHQFGEQNPSSKLSDADRRQIVELEGTLDTKTIANRFGINTGTVRKIQKRFSEYANNQPSRNRSDG
jgi:hypothetical protein